MKKNYTISIPVTRFWTVVVPLMFFLFFAGCIFGAIIIDRIVMPNVVGVTNKGIITVPSVIGMSYEDARNELYRVGLRMQVNDRHYDLSIPKEFIISQQPNPMENVKKNRLVGVVVSKGNENDTIPDVKKLTEYRARKILGEKGFYRINVRKVYNEKYPKDMTVCTEPSEGMVISREIPIELQISKGPRPTHTIVPNITGDMLSEARQKIEESGLSLGQIEYRQNTNMRPGTVVSQSFPPGANVPIESGINMVIAATN